MNIVVTVTAALFPPAELFQKVSLKYNFSHQKHILRDYVKMAFLKWFYTALKCGTYIVPVLLSGI